MPSVQLVCNDVVALRRGWQGCNAIGVCLGVLLILPLDLPLILPFAPLAIPFQA